VGLLLVVVVPLSFDVHLGRARIGELRHVQALAQQFAVVRKRSWLTCPEFLVQMEST
jgi:hypothetical protein